LESLASLFASRDIHPLGEMTGGQRPRDRGVRLVSATDTPEREGAGSTPDRGVRELFLSGVVNTSPGVRDEGNQL
jgi:hypothetical protein